MGAVQFYNGVVLFNGGKVAMDPDCCCGQPSTCECPEDLPATIEVSEWEQYVLYATAVDGTYKLYNYQTQVGTATLTKASDPECSYSGTVTFHNKTYNIDGTVCGESDQDAAVVLTYGFDEHGHCRWLYNSYAFHHGPFATTPVGTWEWDHFDTFSAPEECQFTADYDFSHQYGTWVVSLP